MNNGIGKEQFDKYNILSHLKHLQFILFLFISFLLFFLKSKFFLFWTILLQWCRLPKKPNISCIKYVMKMVNAFLYLLFCCCSHLNILLSWLNAHRNFFFSFSTHKMNVRKSSEHVEHSDSKFQSKSISKFFFPSKCYERKTFIWFVSSIITGHLILNSR